MLVCRGYLAETHAERAGQEATVAVLDADVHARLDGLDVLGVRGVGADAVLLHQRDQVGFGQQLRWTRRSCSSARPTVRLFDFANPLLRSTFSP